MPSQPRIAELELLGARIHAAVGRLASGEPRAEPGDLGAWIASLPVGVLARVDLAVRALARHETFIVADVTRLARGGMAWATLGVASMSADGRVREAAVRALATLDGEEIPFLVLRANDWVPQVRTRALTALAERLVPRRATELARALPLLLDLRERTRHDHGPLLAQVLGMLADPASEAAVRTALSSPDRQVRQAAYEVLAGRPGMLAAALADPEPGLRLRAIRHASPADVEVVRVALRDPMGPLRAAALRLLVGNDAAQDAEIEGALVDGNDEARAIARVEAARRGWDVPALYRARTDSCPPAVLGLAEASPAEATVVTQLLSSPHPGIRRAAVRALGWITGEFAGLFLAALEDPAPGVAGEARRQLLRAPAEASPSDLRALLARRDAPRSVRIAALDVLAARGKWAALADVVAAAGLGVPALTARACVHLEGWLERFNRRQVPPVREDVARAREALRAAALPPRMAAEVRLILETLPR